MCKTEAIKLAAKKTAASAKRKSTSSRSSRSTAGSKAGNDKVLWSTLLFAAAVLTLAFTVIKGESAWLAIHNFLLGMFGMTVFLVSPVMIYASFMIAREKDAQNIKGKVIQGIVLIIMLCAALQIFMVGKMSSPLKFGELIAKLFDSGKALEGGGLTSIILGIPLLALFGKTGAGIVIVLLTFVWIMLLANKTVIDIFNLFRGLAAAADSARGEYKPVAAPERTSAAKRTKAPAGDASDFIEPPGAKGKSRNDFNIDIAIPSKSKKDSSDTAVSEEVEEISRIIEQNENAKAASKARREESKQKSADAKKNILSASNELDSIIKKAALSGRSARQTQEAEQMKRFDRTAKNEPVTEDETPSEDTSKAVAVEKTAAAAENAPAETTAEISLEAIAARAAANSIPVHRVADTIRTEIPSATGQLHRTQKSSTLASNKITDEEDLDMPETMTAHDIQKEINAEAKKTVEYHFPPIDLLKPSHNEQNAADAEREMKTNADTLVETLKTFGVMTRIVDIHRGPTVTRYEIQPSAGVKIKKITELSNDIAMNLAASGVRIEAPIPGKAAVGIEVPNRIKDTVGMRDIIDSEEFKHAKSKLTFAVGKNIDGQIVLGDIAKLPHIIIAGTTGSGKSVCTNGIIMSLLYNATPDEVRLVLIDPKVVEFKIYDGIPHLLIPVVTDPRKAAGALAWAVQEMLKRYKLFADNGVRDIDGYNTMAQNTDGVEPLPRIVIVIDELADLMMAAAKEVEDSIIRLAQMARAAGMHLIIATQRPTKEVVTGLIKANIPSRIALRVASDLDSRLILNENGAEKLLGQGDMLYFPTTFAKPLRVQNCFTSDKEVAAVVDYIKNGSGDVEYDADIMNEIENNIPTAKGEKNEKPQDNGKSYDNGTDEDVIERAIECVVDNGQCSTSYLQRKLKLGYARAARIVDELEDMGIVGPADGAKPRQILMSKEVYMQKKYGTDSEMFRQAMGQTDQPGEV